MDINDLKRERKEHEVKARKLLDLAEEAGRDLSSDEEQQFDRLMEQADGLGKRISREERLRSAERRQGEQAEEFERQNRGGKDDLSPEQKAFRQYILGGRSAVEPGLARALNAGTDPEGGYLVAPQQWVSELIQRVDDAVPLRSLATQYTVTKAESLGVPTLETDLDDAEWTSEVATGSQDDALRLGKRELRPHPLAKRVKISRKLMRLATISPEALVQERMAYKFAVTQEKAFMTGNGNEKPLGLFTASAQGINTDRDKVVYDQSDTKFLADKIIDAKYFMKAAYWPTARWLFHRDAIAGLRKLRDDTGGSGLGNFLWKPGLAGDQPDTLLDLPITVSEWVPNTFTNGLYIGMLGSFKHYWIVDALDMEVQRLNELYAETNQIGYIGRQETDAMPVLSEAFVRLSVQS